MNPPATLQWETDAVGNRTATATVGGRPAVLQIVRRPHGTYQVVATVVLGSSTGPITADASGPLETVAQAWLDRVGGQATGDDDDDQE